MTPELLNLPPGYAIRSLTIDDLRVQVILASTAECATCPCCQALSTRLHSHYLRKLADVPYSGRQVLLQVWVPKWRCVQPACSRRIFAQRLDPLARAWARMTSRLMASIQAIGLATNGEGGARLAEKLGITTSPSTMLRRIVTLPDPRFPPPEEIGLDEWSYRRGKRFGAIIVDLQRRKVIDLLPDREAATVVTWLQAHPTVRLVSRDRSREFARAITLGAPQAQQVLDRFHLLRNLVEKMPTLLARVLHAPSVPPRAPERVALPGPSIPDQGPWKPALTRQAEALRLARQTDRNARFVHLQSLREQGLSAEEIGQHLGMKPRTVRYWLAHFRPDTRRRKRASEFDRYAEYVRQRWQAGCTNGTTIWRELQALGYSGSLKSVAQHLRPLRQQTPPSISTADIPPTVLAVPSLPVTDPLPALRPYTLTQTQWLFVARPSELQGGERQYIADLCQAHPPLASVYDLVQDFRTLIRERPGVIALTEWVHACQTSHLPEFVRFAKGLHEEWDAVVAAFTHLASNGQTEGSIHKLKLIKRQHFGRAGFVLLRKHILLAD